LEDLRGLLQHRRRYRQSERLGRLQVDDEVELCGDLNGEVAWLRALQDLVDIASGLAVDLAKIDRIAHQAAVLDPASAGPDRWQPRSGDEVEDARSFKYHERVAEIEQRVGALTAHGLKGLVEVVPAGDLEREELHVHGPSCDFRLSPGE